MSASFVYDGDGNRVKGTVGGVTMAYVGSYFEWSGSTSTMQKYYYGGGTRVAMRQGGNNPLWLLGDHLGSTSKVANSDGLSVHSEQLYKPWGEKRYPTGAPTLPTTFRYTGQRSETGLGPSGGEGLYFYGSRWYDDQLGRFTSPDTIIPGMGNVQAWDRYAYSLNSPVRYQDPSGHAVCDEDGNCYDRGKSAPGMRFGETPDPVKLGIFCNHGVCYSGQNMLRLYDKYRQNTEGWWYEAFGREPGEFTVRDFFTLMLYYEMANNIHGGNSTNQGIYSYAISQKYSLLCVQNSPGGTCSGVSDNGMLNYLATRGSVWKRYDEFVTGGKPINDTNEYGNISTAKSVVDDALGNITLKGSGADWGNSNEWPYAVNWIFF